MALKREDFKEVKILLERQIADINRQNDMINIHGLTPTEIEDINVSFENRINPFKAALNLIHLATRTKEEISLDYLKADLRYHQSLRR